MKFTTHYNHGVNVRVYQLDKDERIARHSEPFEQTISVANGRARLFSFPTPNHTNSIEIKPNVSGECFVPSFIEYEILSMENGTIVLSMSAA